MSEEKFGQDYFLHGQEKGLSNYTNYSWKPDATLPMVDHLKRYLRIKDGETVFEVGASRGYCVKALRMRGVEAWGYDISKWAVDNCDPMVIEFMSNQIDYSKSWDYLYSKDTLEHLQVEELCVLLPELLSKTRKKALFIVPLTDISGNYINPADASDATHIIKWGIDGWISLLSKMASDFVVNASYHIPLLKQGSETHHRSAGFFTLSRFNS